MVIDQICSRSNLIPSSEWSWRVWWAEWIDVMVVWNFIIILSDSKDSISASVDTCGPSRSFLLSLSNPYRTFVSFNVRRCLNLMAPLVDPRERLEGEVKESWREWTNRLRKWKWDKTFIFEIKSILDSDRLLPRLSQPPLDDSEYSLWIVDVRQNHDLVIIIIIIVTILHSSGGVETLSAFSDLIFF
jgi:hypothetical protein